MIGTGASVLWGRGFRPFFLLAGLQALSAVGLWLAILMGMVPAPAWATAFQWHAHEMLFGFAGAAVAGFLLTSVPVWTGRRAVTGGRLAGFVGLWLAGRAAVFFAGPLASAWAVGALDVAFFAALAVAIGVPIYATGSRRNYAFPVLAVLLAVANGLTHLGAAGWPGYGGMGLRLGIGVVVLVVSTLGGRLVPLFTAAALKRRSLPGNVRRQPWADAAAGPLLAGFVLLDTLRPGSPSTAALALAAAFVLTARASGWGLRASFGDPLLWSMHVAYWWIPIGLATLGASTWIHVIPRNVAIHALTVGAVGGMILAIMSRVALGHTGRPLSAPRGMSAAYALVAFAALTRTLLLVLFPVWTGALFYTAGLLWMAAFAVFLGIYAPFLIAPRIDGKPG